MQSVERSVRALEFESELRMLQPLGGKKESELSVVTFLIFLFPEILGRKTVRKTWTFNAEDWKLQHLPTFKLKN